MFQRKALNDPFTGGLSSYGLVLMVAFALLRRDTFSTAANTTRTNTNTAVETQTRPDDRELNRGPLPSPMGRADSPRKDECGRGCACEDAPPSPSQGHSPCSPPSLALAKQSKCFSGKAGRTIGLSSLGRQRGFWQRSSLSENRSTAMAMLAAHTQKIVGTGEGRPSAAEGRDAFNVDVFWDRCVSFTLPYCRLLRRLGSRVAETRRYNEMVQILNTIEDEVWRIRSKRPSTISDVYAAAGPNSSVG